jgi:hypothetical protein
MAYIFFFLGVILGFASLVWLGVILFSGAAVFALVTLPVEWNASHRAKAMLLNTGLVTAEEYRGVSDVLLAAALTYLATLFQAVANLAYFAFMALGMGRRS